MHALLIAINSKYVHTALGLRYVGEYAKAQGFDVHLIEETINTPILAVLENIMDVKTDVYEIIRAHAEKQGESVNGFIKRAINEAMERDNNE